MIFDAGADVITTGNHVFRKKSIEEELERNERLLRPANYGDELCGRGMCELDFGSYSVAVINLLGTTYLQPLDNPFKYADRLLEQTDSRVIIVDFHAEATSEKRAMGYYLAGRTSAVLGTHTHVQTADEQIIDGTGYITDAGMTGAVESILGVDKDIIIEKFLTYYPKRHEFAGGDCDINGVSLEIDAKSGKCISIQRIKHRVSQ
jgi:metallophosphoesterase (TIGR00282 family)